MTGMVFFFTDPHDLVYPRSTRIFTWDGFGNEQINMELFCTFLGTHSRHNGIILQGTSSGKLKNWAVAFDSCVVEQLLRNGYLNNM
jgi:hypothetical protein